MFVLRGYHEWESEQSLLEFVDDALLKQGMPAGPITVELELLSSRVGDVTRPPALAIAAL